MDQPTFNARMDELDAANPVPAANAARRMTSLDIKIAAAKRRAEAEKATHAIPQAVPTQGLTSEFSTAGCNIANQRKPAHGGRVTIDAAASAGSADPAPVFVVGQGPAAETVAEVIEAAAAGTQPSPEQIKAAIQERERTEAQLRATWEPQTRAQRLNRKAFSDGIAAGMNKALEGLSDDAVRGIKNIMPTLSGPDVDIDDPQAPERIYWAGLAAGAVGKLNALLFHGSKDDPFKELLERLRTCPAAATALVQRMRDQGMIPPRPLPMRDRVAVPIPVTGGVTVLERPELKVRIESAGAQAFLTIDYVILE